MRLTVLFFAIFVCLCAPVYAGDEVTEAQKIITDQIGAIARNDAASAYSFAAPGVRKLIVDAESFLAVVHDKYAPIYRNKAFKFGEAGVADGNIVQTVHIIDADGVPWEGLYTLERQPDQTLKISGCILRQLQGLEI